MAKRSKRAILKDKTWKAFSKYIRLRDANNDGIAKCVTCEKEEYWNLGDAGHFVGGRTNAVLFHEEIVNFQCKHCNIFLRGNYQKYTLVMLDRYGREKVDYFLSLKYKIVKYSMIDLENLRVKYEEKAEDLARLKGL